MIVPDPDKPPGAPFDGFWVPATCPNCAGGLTHLARGVPSGLLSRAIARCSNCHRTWAFQVVITDAGELGRGRAGHKRGCPCAGCVNARGTRTHGTESTYNKGCRCGPCTTAATEARSRRRTAGRRAA